MEGVVCHCGLPIELASVWRVTVLIYIYTASVGSSTLPVPAASSLAVISLTHPTS